MKWLHRCLLPVFLHTVLVTGVLGQFDMSTYDVTFNQNPLASTILVNISCSFDGEVTYEFNNPSLFNFLTLNQTTGVVSLAIDALDITTGERSSFVTCSDVNDASNSDNAVFTATRINENEHIPRFLHSTSLALSFSEDLPVDTFLLKVNATDDDRGDFGVIEYSIQSTSNLVHTLFTVDATSGELFLQASLDFEVATEFNFVIRGANVLVDPVLGRNLALTINVMDTDDTPPVFENPEYDVSVHETVINNVQAGMDFPRPSPGFLITRCTDADTLSDQITYSLEGDISPLVLNETTGSFSVTDDLDYETRTSYTFMVTCYDNSERNQSSTVGVDVAILPVNEEVPQIVQDLRSVSFMETTEVGDIIATADQTLTDVNSKFLFVDSDAGSDGNVTYSLRDGSPGSGDSQFFSLDLISGDMTITEVLDCDDEGVSLVAGRIRRFFVSIVGCDEYPPSIRCLSFDFNIFVVCVNEFAPVIAEERYTLSFSELYSVGNVILSASDVNCQDQDRGEGALGSQPAEIVTTSDAIRALFHIDTTTGEILLQESFDYETAQSHGFEIRCSDSSTSQVLSDTAVVFIDILPENDNLPVFDQRSYIFNVSRTTPANRYVIGMVSATDGDLGPHGDTTFSVASNGFVDINQNGELLLFAEVLNITQTAISFEASVTDGEFTDNVLVVIQITEGNTNRPTFAIGTSTSIQLSELAMVGEVIADLSCTDPDNGTNGALVFSISSGNVDDTFSFDPVSGEISVNRALVLPQNATTEQYILSLLCADMGVPVLSDDATLFVTVFQDDSNPPVINETVINLFVSEDKERNTIVTTIEAVDIDSEELNYRLENESSPGFFLIDPNSGELQLGASLDREMISEFHMVVVVTEIRIVIGPERSDSVIVNIFIRDVNDNDPVCTPAVYSAEVDETATVGESIVQLDCDDSDLNENGLLTYTLEDDFNVLNINIMTGEITVGSTLNNTEQTFLPVLVTVADSGISESRSIQVQVAIEIISRNNNPPLFQNLPAAINVSEAQTVGDVFFMVSAFDPDRGSFGQVAYSITGEEQSTFDIISNTGGLLLITKLNFFSQQTHVLNISAQDSDFIVYEILTINVLDANEFVPVCESAQESFSLAESIEPSALVFPQLSCNDGDEGGNGQITYTIQSGNTDDIFQIQTDGTVATIDVLDYETVQEYDLDVLVSDGGSPPLTTNVMIRVTVTPVNEFAPIFSQTSYSIDVIEHTDIQTFVLEAEASDQDLSTHRDGQIAFSTSGQDASFFTISSTTGVIRISSNIDREMTGDVLTFTVIATDQGIIPRSSSVEVNITVVDIDDTSPQFTEDLYVFDINTTALAGSSVGSILCTDADSPINAQVSYSFMETEEASTTFVIQDTGSIEFRQDIPINTVFTFGVVCTGPSPQNRSDTATVSVRIILNSTISFYPSSTYFVDIDENSNAGTELVVINASSTTGAVLSFNQLNLLSQFQVNELTGSVQLIGALDFETTESYTLRVEATDNGNPPNTNEALVQVNVVNLNDRTPTIITVPTEISREEQNVNGTLILDQYVCSDGDRGLLGVISFRIANGDPNGVFSIVTSGSTGTLLLVDDLDYEEVTDYTLQIVCEDGGTPPLSASIAVPITVIPLNDNPPVFGTVLPISLSEDQPLGPISLPIVATDMDSPPHNSIRYSFERTNPDDTPFSISPTTGQLTLDSSLDFESTQEYILIVGADDSGGLSDSNQFEVLSSTVNVTITITDVNDNRPQFSDFFYNGAINETASIGEVIEFTDPVLCTDADNEEVTYSLTSGVPFEINSNGVVCVAEALDHETTQFYRFSVFCSDSETTISSNMFIFVVDVNEHGPVFVSHTYNFTVSEDEDISTVIGTVEASDQDGRVHGTLTYELSNSSLPFKIDSGSGEITVAGGIDYEEQQLYNFLVEASDMNGNRDTAMVTIKVDNINDNTPEFSETLYFLTVRESTPVDTFVGQVMCEDLDDEVDGIPVQFSFGTQTIPFRVDSLSGEIFVNGEVDFETIARYMIQVFCTDSGNSQVSSNITINLEPFNDFAPQFTTPSANDSVLEVFENVQVGTTLVTIAAFDQDQGGHNVIVYSIEGGNEANVFTIGSSNGFLQLLRSLDREMVPEYTLLLEAENVISADDPGNSTSLSTIISYTIVVLDINDNSPVITPDSLPVIELPESNSTNVDIAFFECNDADEGNNGRTNFSLSSAGSLDSFEITENGVVRTVARVTSSTVLDIVCSDNGNPPRSDTVSLAINLVIINEHAPMFSSPTYSFSVPENETVGNVIGCVNATDNDGPETLDGVIRFSLILESTVNSFSIQEDTGCLFVAAPLSFDMVRSYFYQVVATDSGSEPLSSSAQIMISIEDSIANSPVFQNTPYSPTLFENQESGTHVVQLVCIDLDVDDVSRYSILDGNTDGIFALNTTTGVITLAPNMTLDFEMSTVHSLTVACTDLQDLQTTTVVIVTVSPVNEHTPTFVFGPFEIEENAVPGSELIQLQHFDGDDGLDGMVVFELLDNILDDAFIVMTTGLILVNGELDRESVDFYSFEVRITDQSLDPQNRRMTSHLVNVTILDQNDNEPVFMPDTYNFGPLNGNETVGFTLGNISCTDFDLGANSDITYSISDAGNGAGLFDVNPNTGTIFVSGDLEARQFDDILLFVECEDSGNVMLSDTGRVVIGIQEVNRNSPEFLNESYFAQISENTSLLNTVIITVEARDMDDGVNGQVRYFIVDDIDNTFFIDEESGGITLLRSLDAETTQFYILTVAAIDGPIDSNTQRTALVNVSIEVTGINEFTPLCRDPIYAALIDRFTSGPIIDFQCTDDDVGIDGDISYTILSGDDNGFFVVNASGFLIIPDVILPDSNVVQFELEVEILDMGSPSLQSTIQVILIYSFDNLDDPTFTIPAYSFNVSELLMVGSVFGSVQAVDTDPGLQGRISYSVEGSNNFEIDPFRGDLYVSRPLDWETVPVHTFIVIAQDSDPVASLRGEVNVTVLVSNENDNVPQCPESFYPVEIFSNVTINETVLQLECNDPDQSPVEYELVPGQLSPFEIEQLTGRVYVTGPVAPSVTTVLQVRVVGSDGEFTEITVSIQAVFINVLPPIFDEQDFMISVSESTSLLSVVGSISASDADSQPTDLVYFIEDLSPPTEFYINPSTGEVVLTAPLDFEQIRQYSYRISVLDSGSFDGSNQLMNVANLTVNVTNSNDNTPALSDGGIFGATVVETTQQGTSVVNISCSDSDLPPFSSPQLSINLSSTPFELVATDEMYTIQVSQPLSGPEAYIFNAVCTDAGGLSNEGQVYLFVPEPLAPVFTQPRYEWSLSEGSESGEVYDNIIATSNDGSAVTYSISEGNDEGLFYIEPDTGDVTLIRTLDFETQTSHGVVIAAVDGKGRMSSVLLIVHVTDENDEVPLTPPTALLSVRQNDPVGHPIGVLECTDQGTTINATFSFNPPNELFSVDNFGVVRLQDVLSDTPVYSIPVLCFDVTQPEDVVTGIVTIEVEFVNLFPPVFASDTYFFSIAEDVDPLSFVGEVSATDQDIGSFGDVNYEIIDGNPDTFFIDSVTGRIGVLTSLDRETTDLYVLTVAAVDGGLSAPREERLNTTTNITIQVTDANDNAPVPDQFTYVQSISTNHTVLSPVLTVVCTDLDLEGNGAIGYSIEPSSGEDFIIQSDGVVLLARDQDVQTVHNFEVVCTDQGAAPLSSTAQVTVVVDIISITAPVFDQDEYNVTIDEDFPLHTPILEVLATPSDPSIDLFYSIVTEQDLFVINPASGVILLIGDLDASLQQEHVLTVSATTLGRVVVSSVVNVLITVRDLNDNTPQFSSPFYTTNVTEGSNLLTPFVQLTCTDADLNTDISYSIVYSLSIFNITEEGLVYVAAEVDFERNTSHIFEVVCSDGGEPPQTTSTSVRINVDPVNEFIPTFSQSRFNFTASENSFGAQIGILQATDGDDGSHGDVRYFLQDPVNTSVVLINSLTGELTVADNLDFETQSVWVLSVIAIDGGGLESSTIIQIEVLNLNDVIPVISPLATISTISSDRPADFPIQSFTCTDQDGSQTSLSINSGNSLGLFELNTDNVLVWTGQGDTLDANAVISLNLICVDTDSPSQQASGHIAIRIQVTDAQPPVFSESVYQRNVSENAEVGTTVLTVSATSESMNTSYSFFNLPASFPFEINSVNGEVTLTSSLNRETESLYTFFVGATDVITSGVGVVLVEIIIEDSNDNEPVIFPSEQTITLPEDYSTAVEFIRFMCSDRDSAANGELSFNIISGNDNDSFTLLRVTPQIVSVLLASPLDFESESEYTLEIECRDSGSPSFANSAALDVVVSGVNEFRPVFVQASYSFQINETAPPGSLVGQVTAMDLDEGEDGTFTYEKQPILQSEYFTINSIGEIRTTSLPLNSSVMQQLQLSLRAVDTGGLEDVVLVTVEVLDVNTQPFFSDFGSYFVTLTINQTIPELIFELFCYDIDINDNAAVSIQVQNEHAEVLVESNPQPGLVTASFTLISFLAPGSYDIMLTCSDSGTPPLALSTIATIQVQGENTPPEFSHDDVFISILEDTTEGTFLTSVNASDTEGNITYAIVGGTGRGNFFIDSITGDIQLLLALDHEQITNYVLTVGAFDDSIINPLSTRININIDIININDEHPILTPQGINQIVISENEPLGENILSYSYTCVDPDGGRVMLTISPSGPFRVGQNGEVELHTAIDSEVQDRYVLEITCTDSEIRPSSGAILSSSSTLIVVVRPVNAHAPVFNPPFELLVREDTSPGSRIGQLSATDLDMRGNVTFSSDSHTDLFLVEALTGDVVLIGSLDYETLDRQYNLSVVANDNDQTNNSQPMMTTAQITISVTDVNDNSPECEPYLTHQLPTGTYNLTVFAQLSCTDEDSGVNSLLVYALQQPVQSTGEITVNSSTGEVALGGTFNTPGAIVFTVIVTDSGDVQLSTQTTIALLIVSSDNNALHFNPAQFNVTLSENAQIDTLVFDGATLQNSLVNPAGSEIKFSLQQTPANGGAFVIDSTSADITLIDNKNLDFESVRVFTVPVDAVATSNPDTMATALILVIIEDFNDNPPVFSQPVYTAEISENLPTDTFVIQVLATDVDSDLNSVIRYSIESLDFAIDPTSGEITSLLSFDRETNERYSLLVTATDMGTPSLNSTALVTITILDQNDEPPVFRASIYEIDIDNLEPEHANLLTLEVTDIDANSSLRFQLVTDDSETFELFNVDVEEGIIRRGASPIPVDHRDQYNFTVQVTDGRFEDTTTVIVYVASVTTDSVVFEENVLGLRYNVSEFLILQDQLNSQSGNVTYQIAEGDSSNEFSINLDGLLVVNDVLDREIVSHYTLTIDVRSEGSLNINVYLTVIVQDQNDNAPTFDLEEFTFTIPEGTYQDPHSIGVVTAFDMDAPGTNNANLQFSIIGARFGDENYFAVDPKTGELFVGKGAVLDRENAPNATIVVRARDFGEPSPLFSSVSVVINLSDVNDNDPEFVPVDVIEYFVLLCKQDIAENTVLDNIVALLPKQLQRSVDKFEFTDPDSSSTITATLIDDSKNNFYKLEQNFTANTATLLSNTKIPATSQEAMLLQISLSDDQPESNPIVRNISIFFTDVVPVTPSSGPLTPSTPFFQSDIGIAVIVVICLVILSLLFLFICTCCYCYVRLKREKDPLRNRDRMITVAQRLANTETDRKGRKGLGRGSNYFGYSDLDPLEFPEYSPPDQDTGLLYSTKANGVFESSFMSDEYGHQNEGYDPELGDFTDPFNQSTETSTLPSPLDDSYSDSSRGYTMGPVLRAILEEWDKGDELLVKSSGKKKRKKAKEPEEQEFFY